MANNNVPKGKHTMPAIALAATGIGSFLSAPVTTTATLAGATAGSKAADTGMKFATGKTWAQNIHDKTGLAMEAAEMTNPGMWVGGGAPFMTRGSHSLLSVGDQIVKDMTTDVMKYGPTTVIRNPEGWSRPYIDQVKNGWQGWKDVKMAQKASAIKTDVNQPYFDSFANKTGRFDGTYKTKHGNLLVYDYPNHSEGLGSGIYGHFDPKGRSIFAVT